MSIDQQAQQTQETTLDLRQVMAIIWQKLCRYPFLLVGCWAVIGGLALLLAWVVTPSYTAYATVGPPSSSLTSSMAGVASGLSGLASELTGTHLGGSQADPYSQYTELLTSGRLTTALAKQDSLMQEVFYKQYDSKLKRWRRPSGLLRPLIDALKVIFHRPIKDVPDQDSLQRFLDSNLTVTQSLTSPFTTVSLDFHNPKIAEQLLGDILATADSLVRQDMRRDVSARLVYLNKILPEVTQSDQRAALIALVSQQQQLMMTLTADARFASSLIDPPHASQIPSFPTALKFAATAFLLGIIAWAGIVFLLPGDHWILRRRTAKRSGNGVLSWIRRLVTSSASRRSESW